jgi:glycosyltransferase involved in cell wall biosynthesis
MRICHLLAADTTDQELTTIAQLLTCIDRHHFQQHVASAHAPTGKRAGERLDVDVRRVNLRLGGYVGSSRGSWAADEPPDVIHVWSRDNTVTTSLIAADHIGVVLPAAMRHPSRQGLAPTTIRVLQRATIVCDSQAERDVAIGNGHDPSLCVVVPPAIAVEPTRVQGKAPTRAALDLPEDQPVLLTPGPPSRRDGQYYAVWATALLQQLFPRIRLLVPGDSPERDRLLRFVHSFKLPEILVCTGWRWSFNELAGLADALVAPCLADVPSGSVVWAMSLGLPVVASDVPSMRERIDHGVTGLLTPAKNPTRLAASILRLIEDAALRERLADQARRHVVEAYPVEQQVRRYETLYERVYGRVRTLAMGRRL